MKQNIILADCYPDEIEAFVEGCNSVSTNSNFKILSFISIGSHKGVINNINSSLKISPA